MTKRNNEVKSVRVSVVEERAIERIKRIENELERVTYVEEITLPTQGTESNCEVIAIRYGKVKSLIDISKIKNEFMRDYFLKRLERRAIQIVCIEEQTKEIVEDTIVVSYHNNSRYVKIASRYGKIKVGDKLKVIHNGRRWKIV